MKATFERLKAKVTPKNPDPLFLELLEKWCTKSEGENARLTLERQRSFVGLKKELEKYADTYPAINQHFDNLAKQIDHAEELVKHLVLYPRTGEVNELANIIILIVQVIIGPYVKWEFRPEIIHLLTLLQTKLIPVFEANYDEAVLDRVEYVLQLARYGVQREKPHEITREELYPDQGWEEEEAV